MFFYISIFIVVLFLIFIEEQMPFQKKVYCDILILLILGLLTGFRAIGGTDFGVYYSVYNNTPDFFNYLYDYSNLHEYYHLFNMEKGYIGYISFIKTFLGLSFYGYLVLQSIIIYTCMYIGLKRYMNHWGIFILIFLYKMFFYETFISMRQPLTIVLFYLILPLIYERKALKYYLILTFIILPFHNGAIFLYLVYLINYFNLTKQKLIILNIIFIPTTIISELGIDPIASFSFLTDFVSDPVMKQKALNYMGGEETLSIFHTLEYLLVMGLLIINYDKIVHQSKYAPLMVKLFLILLPIMTLFRSNLFFRREIDYFVPTYAIILGYLCDIYKSRKWMVILGVAIISCYGFIRYITLFDGGTMLPYRSWLELYGATLFE